MGLLAAQLWTNCPGRVSIPAGVMQSLDPVAGQAKKLGGHLFPLLLAAHPLTVLGVGLRYNLKNCPSNFFRGLLRFRVSPLSLAYLSAYPPIYLNRPLSGLLPLVTGPLDPGT